MPGPSYAIPPTQRHSWGWQKSLLEWTLEALEGEMRNPGASQLVDLSHVLVVVPTSTTRRRILAALAEKFATHGLLSPQIWTPGELTDHALPLDADVAATMEMRLAWTSVLLAGNLADLIHLFPLPPKEQNFSWAFQLSGVLTTLAKDVADVGLDFAMVAGKLGENHREAARWAELARLERSYLKELAKASLRDAHAARRTLLKQARLPEAIAKVWVVGLTDPPMAALDVLQKWGMDGLSIQVAVWADATLTSQGFDDWGRPLAEFWAEQPIPLSEIRVHQDPAGQADAMVAWLVEQPLRGALGLADAELQAPLQFQLETQGLHGYIPEGLPMPQHVLSWMVTLLAELLAKGAWHTFAKLLRVPCVLQWVETAVQEKLKLDQGPGLLRACDEFQAERLPLSLKSALQLAQGTKIQEDEKSKARDQVRKVEAAVETVLGVLREFQLASVAEVLPRVLHLWCQQVNLPPASRESRAFAQAEQAMLASIRRVERAVALFTGEISPAQQLELIIRDLETVALFPDQQKAGEFSLQGWLELLWEPAAYLAVGGLNEGRVPESIVGDAWLPHSQRELLGMRTNADRFARDAYILQSLQGSRQESGQGLLLTLGRSASDGSPLKPSRLLVQCELAELPGRVDYLFNQSDSLPSPVLLVPSHQWKLRIPAPDPSKLPLAKISVTSFRDYLACPLRYYLKHFLRMQAYDADPDEPDSRAFGNLCHDALMAMARDPIINRSTDAARIESYLREEVYRRVRDYFGEDLSLPLFIYRETACNRLAAAAEIHAHSRAQGWFVWKVEESINEILGHDWTLEGVSVIGRVDLIEVNAKEKSWRIVDYKTADKAKKPEEAHLTTLGDRPSWQHTTNAKGNPACWSDLQLPLYVAALSTHPELLDLTPGAAYINLPSAASETKLETWENLAETNVQLSAVACAREVLCRINQAIFLPPTAKPRYDDFKGMFLEDIENTMDVTSLQSFMEARSQQQPPPDFTLL